MKKKKTEEPEQRKIEKLPEKLGPLSLKFKDNEYEIIFNKEVVGSITTPRQCGAFYLPSWGVYKGLTLVDCFVSIKPLLDCVSRTFGKIEKKKK